MRSCDTEYLENIRRDSVTEGSGHATASLGVYRIALRTPMRGAFKNCKANDQGRAANPVHRNILPFEGSRNLQRADGEWHGVDPSQSLTRSSHQEIVNASQSSFLAPCVHTAYPARTRKASPAQCRAASMSSIWPCTRKCLPPGVLLLRWFPMSSAAREREPLHRLQGPSPRRPQSPVRDIYVQTNLVSDIPGMAPNTDPNLQGAWGLSFSTTSPFWVSDQAANFNGSGASTVYKVSDTPIPTSSGPVLTVGVTNQGNAPPEPQP